MLHKLGTIVGFLPSLLPFSVEKLGTKGDLMGKRESLIHLYKDIGARVQVQGRLMLGLSAHVINLRANAFGKPEPSAS